MDISYGCMGMGGGGGGIFCLGGGEWTLSWKGGVVEVYFG